MVLEKNEINRLYNCLSLKKKKTGLWSGGIFPTVNPCEISDWSVFSKRDTTFVTCTKHSQASWVLLGTRLKNIHSDGPRRDVCLHATDFICTFLVTRGNGRVAYTTIIPCPINSLIFLMNRWDEFPLMAVFDIALVCHCKTVSWNSWWDGENGPGLH